MSAIASPIRKEKFSKESLEAADRLLKAVKEKLLSKNGIDFICRRTQTLWVSPVDCDQLVLLQLTGSIVISFSAWIPTVFLAISVGAA